MKLNFLGLAASAALGAALLAGCPAEDKKTDTTTTTTTTTSTAPTAEAAASSTTTTTTTATGAADGAGSGASTTAKTSTAPSAAASSGTKSTMAASTGGIDAKAIFSSKCAGCHGANGGGGMGPSLQHVASKGDALIKTRIMKGSATKGMPAFGDTGMLKAAEVDALVGYVKTL